MGIPLPLRHLHSSPYKRLHDDADNTFRMTASERWVVPRSVILSIVSLRVRSFAVSSSSSSKKINLSSREEGGGGGGRGGDYCRRHVDVGHSSFTYAIIVIVTLILRSRGRPTRESTRFQRHRHLDASPFSFPCVCMVQVQLITHYEQIRASSCC